MQNQTNPHFKLPKVYFVGYTTVDLEELTRYLEDTDQLEFLNDIETAVKAGLNIGEVLCSFYAKACYASLTTKKNKNITNTRSIEDNIISILDSAHGSVLEHCMLNFMVTDCSRVAPNELVRHRAGTAFSQTSGRYVRSDTLTMVVDPILAPAYDLCEEARQYLEDWNKRIQAKLQLDAVLNFDIKKKITSAIRRFLPNGQTNEIGVSFNIRALRHIIETRTSRHAEWEIRYIFNLIYDVVSKKYPIMFSDAQLTMQDELSEITFKNKKI